MLDKHNKISIFVYISILINIIVLALFITFVFGLKKDAFDVDTKKLDRNALICQNSIVSLVNDYDNRLNKIVESYPFKLCKINFGGECIIEAKRTKDAQLRPGHLLMDYKKIPQDAVWRTKKTGDRFTKFGGGSKSLKSNMIDKKIPN